LGSSLVIANRTQVIGASDNSFVDGPVTKVGIQAFTFPTGSALTTPASYHPVSISGLAGDTSAPTEYTAQYIAHAPDADGYLSSSLDTSLASIKDREFWVVKRTAGNATALVSLHWTNMSGIMAVDTQLAISQWSNSRWSSIPSILRTSVTQGQGTISASQSVSGLGVYTFGLRSLPSVATTGVTSIATELDVMVYPTVLTSPYFTVAFGQAGNHEARVTIYSMDGKLIQTDKLIDSAIHTLHLPDGSASGLYLVNISQGQSTYQTKLIYTSSN
jgi:hypothetical protein